MVKLNKYVSRQELLISFFLFFFNWFNMVSLLTFINQNLLLFCNLIVEQKNCKVIYEM